MYKYIKEIESESRKFLLIICERRKFKFDKYDSFGKNYIRLEMKANTSYNQS